MRNGLKILDTDSHMMEPPSMWADYMEDAFRDRAPAPGDMGGGRTGIMCEDEPLTKQDGSYPMHSKEFLEAATRAMERFERTHNQGFNAESRIQDMDEQGVDAQVIYPTVGGQLLGKPFKDTELLAACCRAYNEWSLEYCAHAPDRLRMAAMLPVQAPDLAVEEVKRMKARGAACFYVRPNPVEGRNLYHSEYDPLWTAISDARDSSWLLAATRSPNARLSSPSPASWRSCCIDFG